MAPLPHWFRRLTALLAGSRPVAESSAGFADAGRGVTLLASGRPASATGPRPAEAERLPGIAARFAVLGIDDAGEYLIAAGDRLTVGHLRAGIADLPFLADVGGLHAELERTQSLREGSVWTLRPLGGERVTVDGEACPPSGVALASGTTVRCGENLAFVFRAPDPASRTVLLELGPGAECLGAKVVVLLGEGTGGRVRVGAAEHRHVRIANLPHEIVLVLDGESMLVRCSAGVRGGGAPTEENFRLPFPPTQRFDLAIGKPVGGRPPFGISIAPRPAVDPSAPEERA